MFYRLTKPYYVQTSTDYYVQLSGSGTGSGNGSGVLENEFVKEGLKLLDLYNSNVPEPYFNEVLTNFKNLKDRYPQYKLNDNTFVISTFVDKVYDLLTVNDDLEEEVDYLRNRLVCLCKHDKILLKEAETLDQSANINIIYLQYLLLYDLTLTNGIFMQEYLDEAERIYTNNGNMIYHPTDFERNRNKIQLLFTQKGKKNE